MNSVALIGNLTRDPELRYTADNKPVANFTIAVSRQAVEGTDFIDVSVWNKQAENVKKYLFKGSKVAVEGSIRTGTYEKDGKKYKSFSIMSNKVHFLSSNKQDASNPVESKEDVKTPENASNNPLDDQVFADFGDSIEYDDFDGAF